MRLCLQGVRKTYKRPDGSVCAGLSVPFFSLEQGESAVLTGPSGSGKSTMMRIAAGLELPDEGKVSADGLLLTRMDSEARAAWRSRHVGVIFQKLNLTESLTAEENILLPSLWRGAPCRDLRILAERLGIAGLLKRFPGQMSLGEQQRAAILRALLWKPQLILADEPTASLDRDSAQAVVALLLELCAEEGCSLLLATHDETIKKSFARRYDVAQGRHAAEAFSAAVPSEKEGERS